MMVQTTTALDRAFDIIIIGTGVGGGTLAFALRASGAHILLVERGDYLPVEPENWRPEEVFDRGRYKAKEAWLGPNDVPFHPGVHYFVGGNTKVFGAAFPRLRRQDFMALEHMEGVSPAWPVTYDEMEPYYGRAESIYFVHGDPSHDPTEPPRSQPYPFPAVPHEPAVAAMVNRLRAHGLHPYPMPIGIDLRDGGRCRRCQTCDGFPCRVHAKADADICCVRPALESENVHLLTRAYVTRLLTDASGRHVDGVEVFHDGMTRVLRAATVVVSCGAVNSAALLLRSANDAHPHGLGNSSGLVGRNYMVHNNTALMGVHPTRRNHTVFQKTAAVNDFYLSGPGFPYPMGNLQLLGKLQAGMLTASQPLVPRAILREIAHRSIDWWVMSEDLPDPHNRVMLTSDGQIRIAWRPNNLTAHRHLVRTAADMVRAAGYPLILTQAMGIATNSHQCGTLRFGSDPSTSVLDPYCHSHDVKNLYVVDGSFFPSSSACNPALTIAAQTLRVADHLMSPHS